VPLKHSPSRETAQPVLKHGQSFSAVQEDAVRPNECTVMFSILGGGHGDVLGACDGAMLGALLGAMLGDALGACDGDAEGNARLFPEASKYSIDSADTSWGIEPVR
jgi:hypothetical protein